MRYAWICAALVMSFPACAQQRSAADQVADQFLADDNQPPTSDPKLVKDFEFLNTCSAKRIRASDIKYGDSQDTIAVKVRDAMQKCTEDLYGKDKPKATAPTFTPGL